MRRVIPAANAIFLGHVIVRLGSLVLVPLFLRYWSAPLYGEYVALFAAVGYLSSLDVGVQWATVNRLTQAYAKNDIRDYQAVQHSALAFYILLASAATIIVTALVWLFPIPHWIGLRITTPVIANVVIILLAIYMLWSMPMRLIMATYQTMGNLSRSQWIANAQQIIVVLLSAAALIFGRGMLTIAALQVVSVLIVSGFIVLHLRSRFPVLLPSISGARLSILKELAHPSALFALLLVGNLIAYQGSVLIVSAAMGGLAVAVLSVSKAIIEVVRQGLYSINLALCPDFARMEALGQFAELRTVHRITVAAVAAVTLAVTAAIWYEGPQVITVWTRGRLEPDVTLLRLFLVLMAFQTPWAASSTVATATNRHKAQAVGYFCAAIIGVALVAVLVHRIGTWAVPVGLMIGEALCCYHFVIRASCRIIGEPYRAFALRFWSGFVVVGAAAFMSAWAVHQWMPGPLLTRWLAAGMCTLIVSTLCGLLVWLTPEDRSLVLPKMRPALSGWGIKF